MNYKNQSLDIHDNAPFRLLQSFFFCGFKFFLNQLPYGVDTVSICFMQKVTFEISLRCDRKLSK